MSGWPEAQYRSARPIDTPGTASRDTTFMGIALAKQKLYTCRQTYWQAEQQAYVHTCGLRVFCVCVAREKTRERWRERERDR